MSLRKHLIRYSRHRSAFRVHSLLVISQIPNTNQQRSHRRQGRSKAHEEQRGTVYLTEPVRQRNTEQEGRYQTVNHREQWIPLSAEVRIDAKHKTYNDTVDTIPPQILRRHCHHRHIFGKECGKRLRQELGIHTNRYTENKGNPNARSQAFVHPLYQSRTVILCRHGCHCRWYRHWRQHCKDDDFLHNTQRRRCDDSHLVDNDRYNQEWNID